MTFTVRTAASGGWLAFTTGARVLIVDSGDEGFVAAAWAAIRSESGFQASLDLLTSKGLAATPPFVLVEWTPGSEARVIVRGDAALTVKDAAGSQSLDATGVSTWVERTLPTVTELSFAVPDAVPAGNAVLPLDSGVAYIAAIASDGADPVALAAPREAPPTTPAPVIAVAEPVAAEPEPVTSPGPIEVDVEATVRAPSDVVTAPPANEPEADTDQVDPFGETLHRSAADASVSSPEPPAAPVVDDALHDGETVMSSDVAKLRGKRRPAVAQPAPTAAAKLVLVLPSGSREPLVQPVLIGRSPSVSKVSGGQIPRLLTLGTADQDISRNHAQFALEGGTVVVTDLHSRNGTVIVLPGKSPQKLRAGEPTSVIVGTVVDLGGGITITVEEEA